MLESKNKVFQNIVKSADTDKSADVTEQVRLMRDLNERYCLLSIHRSGARAEHVWISNFVVLLTY